MDRWGEEAIRERDAEIERLRAALKEARDAWADQLERDEEAAGDDEISQPMLAETRALIRRCDLALEQKADLSQFREFGGKE